jgi:uncharacterized membrane protein
VGPASIALLRSDRSEADKVAVTAVIADRRSDISDVLIVTNFVARAVAQTAEAMSDISLAETVAVIAVIADRKSDRLEAFNCTSVGPASIALRRSDISEADSVAVTAVIAERRSLISEAWIGAPAVIALRISDRLDAFN